MNILLKLGLNNKSFLRARIAEKNTFQRFGWAFAYVVKSMNKKGELITESSTKKIYLDVKLLRNFAI